MSDPVGSAPPMRAVEVPTAGLDPRVRIFRAGDEVDTFALVTRRSLIVVDTMATPELSAEIMALLAPELAGRSLVAINTHADYDHCWGNATFATPDGPYPAPIVAHERALERMRSPEAAASLGERQRGDARFANVRLITPTITFADRLTLHGGDLTIECIPTPGHTSDHIALWIPEIRLVLAGDAAEHPFPYIDDAESLPILLHSLQLIAALQPDVLLPCHGGTTDPGLPARNLTYFATVERLTRTALSNGRLPSDAAHWTPQEHQRDIEALPQIIGFPYEDALRQCAADPTTTPPMYHAFHQMAIKVTIEHLLRQSMPHA